HGLRLTAGFRLIAFEAVEGNTNRLNGALYLLQKQIVVSQGPDRLQNLPCGNALRHVRPRVSSPQSPSRGRSAASFPSAQVYIPVRIRKGAQALRWEGSGQNCVAGWTACIMRISILVGNDRRVRLAVHASGWAARDKLRLIQLPQSRLQSAAGEV